MLRPAERGQGMRYAVTAALLGILVTGTPTRAQLADEQLLEPMPSGFRVAAQHTRGAMRETEAIPTGETVTSWSEMVTTQILPGRGKTAPAAFLNAIGKRWIASCPTPQPHEIHTGTSNGYVVSMMLLRCDRSPSTGGPENTLFRTIQGADSFYLVQYAFRSELIKDRLDKAAHFLSQVNVCDTRSPNHPCPALDRIKPEEQP